MIWILVILIGMQWCLIVVLIHNFLMLCDIEYLFMFICNLNIFYGEVAVQVLGPFFNWVVYLLLNFKSSLHILYNSLIYNVCKLANIIFTV